MISCPDCGGMNVIGEYFEDNNDEWEKHYEAVNGNTALGELRFYSNLYCEDCGAEWEGEWYESMNNHEFKI